MKVYVIGDSISIHYGPFLQQALAGVMDYARKEGDDEARLNLDVPMGANGGDSDRVLAFVKAAAGAGGFHRFAADCGAYNAAADRIMAEAGVPMADLFTFTANLGPDLFCDHVHFTVPVRERQAAFLAGWLGAFAAVVGTGPVASGLPPPAGTQS